jgi:replicative DNA helicase
LEIQVNYSKINVAFKQNDIKHISTVFSEADKILEERKNGKVFGYATRWKKFNSIINGGIGFGQNLTIGARPRVGKSAFANILAFDIFRCNPNTKTIVLNWTFEMPGYQLAIRNWSSSLNKPVNELLNNLEDSTFDLIKKSSDKYDNLNMYFIEVPRTVDEIQRIVEDVHKQIGADYKIVNIFDHTRLITKTNEKTEEEKIHSLLARCNQLKKKYGLVNITVRLWMTLIHLVSTDLQMNLIYLVQMLCINIQIYACFSIVLS